MEDLFQNNLAVIFVIAAFSIISYANFSEGQRIFLLYLLSYGTAYWKIMSITHTAILLMCTSFAYLEYLSEDAKKIEILTRMRFKLADYLFQMIFQYHVIWMAFSFVFLKLSRMDICYSEIFVGLSLICIFCGEHLAITQPFKVTTVTEIVKGIEKTPIYSFYYDESLQKKFDILCAFEDKSYFYRKKSYSIASGEYIRYVFKRICSKVKATCGWKNRISKGVSFIGSNISYRGYSTPEMQLLRNLAVERGYEKYKYTRKIYEVIYSKIIFQSLLEHYARNTYKGIDHYRHYLLFVYLHVVPIRVHGRKYQPMVTLFKDKDFTHWSDEQMFVACLGLSFQNVSDRTLTTYSQIIQDYQLSEEEILRVSRKLKNPVPPALPVL